MAKVLSHENKNCSGCGGTLVFSPQHQALECQNCGKVVPIATNKGIVKHEYNPVADNYQQRSEWSSENKVLKCSNCGANVILTGLEFASICPYCKSPNIALTDELPGLKPDTILPFMIDEKEARGRFRKNLHRKWFVPNIVKKNCRVKAMTGTYIPSFAFNCQTYSTYNVTIRHVDTSVDHEGHVHQRTRLEHDFGNYSFEFTNLTIESSSLISQDAYLSVAPFDFSQSVDFNPDFLRGFVVEHYDGSLSECNLMAEDMMTRQIRSNITNMYQPGSVVDLSVQTSFMGKTYTYTLLPFYFFEYTYKKKKYVTAMNGQNGRIGKVPRSAIKITSFVLSIIAIIAAIALAIVFTS